MEERLWIQSLGASSILKRMDWDWSTPREPKSTPYSPERAFAVGGMIIRDYLTVIVGEGASKTASRPLWEFTR